MFECLNLPVLCSYVVFFFVLLVTVNKSVEADKFRSPSVDFKRYTVVHPVVHLGRSRREIRSTRHTEGEHHKQVTVTVDVDGEEYVLELQLNEELVAGDHVIAYQKDGKTVLHKPRKEELDICQYSGTVRDKPGSWVAVSTCHGIRGVIHDGKATKYIEPAEGNSIFAQHFVYDHSDLNKEYENSGGAINNTGSDPQLLNRIATNSSRGRRRISRFRRDAHEEVQGPYNANKQSRYVELVLVADYSEFRASGENLAIVHHQLKDVTNIINSVYAPLRIFIVLVGVVVWNERDEIHIDKDGDKTLNNFLRYRRKKLINQIPNDNAHLLSGQEFDGEVIGKAYPGAMCTYKSSGGIANIHTNVIGLLAATIAHEMGHNFGMDHDSEENCECPDEKCIMSSSSTSVTPTRWSTCSLKSLSLSFEKGIDYCLRNKPKRLFESPTCGNGFVEDGEQCDCGMATAATTDASCAACCDPRTCTLRRNATCAVGACCDPTTCRPKPAATICRTADRECDLAEFCTGISEYCPMDVYKMDTTPCENGQAYCMRGQCRSHSDQCRMLWGPSGKNSNLRCYENNVKGNREGNCGYTRVDKDAVFTKCNPDDVMCGQLKCWHVDQQPHYGIIHDPVRHIMVDNGTLIHCRAAIVDLGQSDSDPGLVPDGAKCGDDKMCLNRRCVSVEMVRERIARAEYSVCPSDCSGHGVCNSEGHCHCDEGFAPPMCNAPGPGGSYDSGPASDISVQRNFMVAMYVIFLGILPLLIILIIAYLSRHKVLVWWRRPKKMFTLRLTECIYIPKTVSSFKKDTTDPKHRTEENHLEIYEHKDNDKQVKHAEKDNKIHEKKFHAQLNKDIVVDNGSRLTDKRSDQDPGETNSPLHKNLPVMSDERLNSKPVLNKKYILSTSVKNDTPDINLNKTYHKSFCNSSKEPNNIQWGITRTITHSNNCNKLPTDKPNIDKSKSINVNRGLPTITNQSIIKRPGKKITKDETHNSTATNINKSKINEGISKKIGFIGIPSNLSLITYERVKNGKHTKENCIPKSAGLPTESQVKNLLRKFEQNKA